MITLVNNATSTGISEAQTVSKDNDAAHSDHTFQVVHTGSPTAITINIEASIDGNNYTCIASHVVTISELSNGTALFHANNKPIGKLRVNIFRLDGGTSPTVSVYYLKGNSSHA